eukprot:gene11614-24314_t
MISAPAFVFFLVCSSLTLSSGFVGRHVRTNGQVNLSNRLQMNGWGKWPFGSTTTATTGNSISPLKKKRVVIVGATGYIGKFVVKESVRRGYETVAICRPSSTPKDDFFAGAEVISADVTDEKSILENAFKEPADVVISCLASRSGTKSDSYAVDYQATLNTLNAARTKKVDQFILLSAFCVRKPLLEFQNAKLKFEEALTSAGDIKCNPIAEQDLATYMINCIDDKDKWNKILDIGGPDEGMTMQQQGDMLFEVLQKEPKFWYVPVGLFDAIIGTLAFFGKFFDGAADAAELGRIGKYYAEKFGAVTLRQHYERIAREGQDFDPYTTMLAKPKN